MADQYDLIPEDYVDDLKNLSNERYSQAVIAPLMLYDLVYHIPQQVQYLHGRKWSKLHVIYFSVLICNWTSMIMALYNDNKAWASKSWCIFGMTLVDFFTTFTSLVVKILLVLRLRAIWNKVVIVMLVLYFVTAAEVLTSISVMIVYAYIESVSGVQLPLHGCWFNTHLQLVGYRIDSAFEIVRATATAIEVLLTFIRFIMTYKTQMVFGDGIRARISHMKTSTRLLYVFYRDGTLLLIPLLVFSCLQAASFFLILPNIIVGILSYFSYFIYPFIVSRLILNLLQANCPLDESIDSSTMESIRFCHSESTRDTEADTSQDSGGTTSLGEEIREEAR